MLWLIFAAITIVTVLILIFPLLNGRTGEAAARVDYDIVVYRDQLGEITEEVESGLLSAFQADAARAEVHHRMLAAEDSDLKRGVRPAPGNRRLQFGAIAIILVVVPAGTAAVYVQLGSPHLPGMPYAWRQANDPEFKSASAADKLKAQLQANPSADGYKNLASMYFTARTYAEAAAADQRAIDLGSNSAASWSELGEAIVMANGGAVVPEAMLAFATSLKMDSQSERSRFYMGLAEAQIGNMKKAVSIWRDLEKTSDPAAPWMTMVRDNIASYAKQGGFDPASVAPASPSAEAMSSALSAMTDAIKTHKQAEAAAPPPANTLASQTPDLSQETMIQGMVAKLAAKMQSDPGDVTGWTRLAHAYNVLNEPDKARAAIDRAVHLQPRNVDILLVLAETQKVAAPGDELPQNFIDTMRRILTLEPTNAAALYNIGIAEQNTGHPQVARQMWTKALAGLAPDDPMAVAARDRLAKTK